MELVVTRGVRRLRSQFPELDRVESKGARKGGNAVYRIGSIRWNGNSTRYTWANATCLLRF